MKHLSDFSARMRASGYGERYRLEVIKSGVEGFEKMVAEEKNGGRPINQRRTWNEDQRQKKKELQKKNWFKRGGFDVPIFVPHTPNGELAKRMREAEAHNHQGRKIRFKIVEKGGVREAPLQMLSPLFGHCPNSNCTPRPSLKRALFSDRFQQIRQITVLTVHKCHKASWKALAPSLT